jgi:hypothetical protein
VKTAAFPPMPPKEGLDGGEGPMPPKNDLGGGGKKRNIPKNHPFDPKSLKPLAKALWASSVAMGHALTAYRHLSRLKSATISPDGMLGGRGYVMDVAEIRKRLNDACESLSAITDTLHDEISAPHWQPRMSELDENEAEDIQNYLGKSEEILENPEEDAENEIEAIEQQNDLDEMDGVDEEGNLDEEGEGDVSLEESEDAEPADAELEEGEEEEGSWEPAVGDPSEEEGDLEEESEEESDEEESDEEEDEDSEDEETFEMDEEDVATAEKAAEATDALWGQQGESEESEEDLEGEELEDESEEDPEDADESDEDEELEEEPQKLKKKLKKKGKPKNKPPVASDLPTGGNAETDLSEKTNTSPQIREASARRGNSSLPVGTLPGGPRIEHLDREDGPPENGPIVLDNWGLPSKREYLYQTPWENDLREAQSGVPDANTDDTPTEAWDFGLGYGARGQGAGDYANPSGEGNNKGVWGPSSGLPGSPPQSSGDTTPKIDMELNERKGSIATYEQVGQYAHYAQGLLPNDTERPAARSDYYRGDRGNLVNTQSGLPSEPAPGGQLAPSLVNTDYTHEDLSTPYVRYDYSTHDYRDDPLHEWPQATRQE